MFDKFLTRTHTRAEHELRDQMRSQRQTIKAALAVLRALGVIILDDSVGNAALRSRLFAAVPRDTLEAQVAGLDEWVTGKKSDVFHGLVRRFSHCGNSRRSCFVPWSSSRTPATTTSPPWKPFESSRK